MEISEKTSLTVSQWHIVTRLLHGFMALGIIAQLLSSQIMAAPDELEEASQLQKLFWESHELIGLFTAGIIFLHWLWIVIHSNDVAFNKLFPYNASGIKNITSDIRYIIANKTLPEQRNGSSLASFIHGLGFLTATIMVLSGTTLYYIIDWGDGAGSDAFEAVAEFHEFFAGFMWSYLAVHAIAAIWHEFKGEHIIKAMSPFAKK